VNHYPTDRPTIPHRLQKSQGRINRNNPVHKNQNLVKSRIALRFTTYIGLIVSGYSAGTRHQGMTRLGISLKQNPQRQRGNRVYLHVVQHQFFGHFVIGKAHYAKLQTK
jgi:hypothetical protein